MKITTKYNVGDKVWAICDNKAYSFVIYKIKVEVKTDDGDICIKYYENKSETIKSDLKEGFAFFDRMSPMYPGITQIDSHTIHSIRYDEYKESQISPTKEGLIDLI